MFSSNRVLLSILFFLISIVIQAQVRVRVRINSGSSTTTCTDGVFDNNPEERYKVQIHGQGYTYYGDTGACYGSLPNVQYDETFFCPSGLPSQLQICLSAFEDDGTACVFSESCPELNCQNFPTPVIGGFASYNLSVGGASTADINFTIYVTGSWQPGLAYDTICNAVNLGSLSANSSIGNNALSNYGNFCATNTGEPQPWGDNNDQGVWFKFTTSTSTTNIISIDAKSDPQPIGDSLDLQLALYQSSNGSCTGSLTHIQESWDGSGTLNDEAINSICLTANTTYFLLVDGQSTSTTSGIQGYFGIQINDNTIDNSVNITGDTLTANASEYSYQWIDCNNSNSPITGETNQSFTISTTGSYAVEISNGSCFTTSNCENIVTLSQDSFSTDEMIHLFPNPTSKNISIRLNHSVPEITARIFSITGQLIQTIEKNHVSQLNIDIKGNNGLYFVEVKTQTTKKTFKLLKKN